MSIMYDCGACNFEVGFTQNGGHNNLVLIYILNILAYQILIAFFSITHVIFKRFGS